MKTYQDKSWLNQKYWKEELSLLEIAKLCGINNQTIWNWMKKYGIKIRTRSEAQKIIQNRPEMIKKMTKFNKNREWLHHEYIEKQLSMLEISKMTNVSQEAIRRQLIKLNIPRRTHSEAGRLWNRANDLNGRIFGRLIVLYDSGKRINGFVAWACLCDCGNLIEASSSTLKNGCTKSCGCLRQESARKSAYKHGATGSNPRRRTRLYGIWCGMKNRCGWLPSKDYKYYGGKGIKVCDEWKNNFIAFRGWALSNGYQGNLTIDRINPNGNYEPNNCQWLTRIENNKKRWRESK